LPWQSKQSSAVFFAAAKPASLFFTLFLLGYSAWAQTARSVDPAAPRAETQIYATADETAPPVGTLHPGEKVKPIAESRGAGGAKWYLVRSQSGVVGWIMHNDGEQTKKIDNFFRNLPAEPNRISTNIPIGSASAAPRGAVTVPIIFSGRSAVVPVIFNRSVSANLVLDTGASMTMITDKLAANLRLPFTGVHYIAGIGGMVRAQVARVDSVKVGEAEVNNMPISIHDPFGNASFEGLLGMDFLGRFQIAVDPVKNLLILTPR
jgi:predicted aspartyl protease